MKISRQIFIMLILFASQMSLASEKEGLVTEKENLAARKESSLHSQLANFLNTYSQELAEQGYRSDFNIGNIDPHLNIKDCTMPLNFTFNRKPLTQNNVTIKAECKDPKPWKLYISIRYDVYHKVIVATGPIPRGQTIFSSQLQTKEALINTGHYIAYSNKDDVIGMVTKYSIRAGSTIQPNQLSAPKLIKKGDNVVIVASSATISVKMNGTALTDGHYGEQISIKNNRSKRIIKGRVMRAGYVSIAL